jgi:hypothetical protein
MTTPVDVQKYLGGINYPANRRQVIDTARSHGADENIIRTLEENLPDRTYDGPNAISRELGKS